jgi:hypothetical protein
MHYSSVDVVGASAHHHCLHAARVAASGSAYVATRRERGQHQQQCPCGGGELQW